MYMPPCKTTPPPGQDVNQYLVQLNDILQQLSQQNNKTASIERIDLMLSSLRSIVLKQDPSRAL